jgi:hypothetical protein
MLERSIWIRGPIAIASVLALLLAGVSAQAATRPMVGSIGVINPSTAPPFFFEGGPAILGKKVGPYAPTTGWTTINVAGTTAGTFTGRTVTLAAGQLDFSGLQIRDFPAFPGVANLTKSFMSIQQPATFAIGGGALAACPGPGCTASGAGTAISWCPPLAEPAATPAPGTVANQVGDWDCPSWPAGAGGGNRFIRMAITNSPGANHFGGTFSLLRNHVQTSYLVLVQPGTDGIAEVRRVLGGLDASSPWTGGRTNFEYTGNANLDGPRLFARLNANGAITQTTGCVNTGGTPGATFMVGVPIAVFGSNCGTPATPTQGALQGWGFRMTTGDIEGSDPFPFGLVITTQPPGTPLSPNVGTQPGSAGFFFTRMGTDSVTGTNRNLVLLGGGVSVSPPSGNAFFRITDLRMNMQVPEPAMGLGLVAGATALAAIARRRRS